MSIFKQQSDFMRAGNIKECSNSSRDFDMAINCISEEYEEWDNELTYHRHDNLNDLKEIIDVIYVAAQYLNICVGHEKAQQLWDIVHAHNMSKCIKGKLVKREDGKVLKPEGFDKWAWKKQFKEVLMQTTKGD